MRPLSAAPTAWQQLLACGRAGDFITAINFPLNVVLTRILPPFEAERFRLRYDSPYRQTDSGRGRRPQLRSVDLIGLALWYLKSSGSAQSMCPVFGLVPSSLNVWLSYSLEVLWRAVKDPSREAFAIRWPTEEEMRASSSLLERNREYGVVLKGIFGIMDGARMPCADYTNKNIQNACYEGCACSEEVTNLFVFNFFGELIHAAVNFPGAWHDSRVAQTSGLPYPLLCDDRTPPGCAILLDSAFSNDITITHGKIVRARKEGETEGIPESAALAATDQLLQRAMPSERQSAEWGVRAVKGPFGRLRVPLSAISSKRLRILQSCCHLYNLRTRYVGLNQIRTTYADKGSVTQPWAQDLIG